MASFNLLQNAGTGNFTTRSVKLPLRNAEAYVVTANTGSGSATITFQGSHDNVNFVLLTTGSLAINQNGKFTTPTGEVYLYYNIVVSSNTGVTISVITLMSSEP